MTGGSARPEPPPVTSPAATVTFPRQGLWLALAGVVVVVAGAGAIGYLLGQNAGTQTNLAASSAHEDVRLTNAFKACEARDTANTMELGDNGRTIIVDTRSEFTSTAGVACVWGELKTPQSITAKVEATTAMMGEQTAESDGVSYSWSYHPDNGLNMVITSNH
jgi:hypothetical protein